MQHNLGEAHSRIATSAVASIAAVGGLTEFFFTGLWLAYLLLGQPFRDLDLAISFEKLVQTMQKDDRPKEVVLVSSPFVVNSEPAEPQF